jgi:hypothetical protein
MSRSYRHTAIFPVTLAKSDKDFKVRAHKQERRLFKIKLLLGEKFEITDVPGKELFGNPWDSNKDGRSYWRGASKKDLSK